MTARRKIIFRIGMALLAGGLVLLGGNLVRERVRRAGGVPLDEARTEELRERLDYNPRSIFVFDPWISYRLKPLFRGLRHDSDDDPHVTNSRGLLGEEEVDPDPAVRKILFLGDSVVYGSHVPFEEIFVSRMARAAGDSFQVLNASCPGWSTHQELAYYRLHLADLPIDAAVIVFTINDLLRFEWVWRDERSFQMSAELRGLGGLIQSHWTARELTAIRNRFLAREELQPLAELNNTCLTAYLPGRWERFAGEVSPELARLAQEIPVVLAAAPARPQLEALNRGGDPGIVLFPQLMLEELAGRSGAAYLDLRPAFREEGRVYDLGLFLPGERGILHLSPEGHRRAAEWLWPELIRRLEP